MTVPVDMSLADARGVLGARGAAWAAVVEVDGRLVGVLTPESLDAAARPAAAT